MISIIHPSRGRPYKSLATICKWVARAGTTVEVVVSVDEDDIELEQYKEQYKWTTGVRASFIPYMMIAKNKSTVDAINNAMAIATGDIFIIVSDDTDCPMNWAVKIEAYTKGMRDFVMKTWDGIQKNMITMPIFDRAYYNRFGYVYNPAYEHLFADAEFSDVAYKLKRVVRKMGFKFPHNQYAHIPGGKPDEVHLKNERTYAAGKALYLERKKINFGL